VTKVKHKQTEHHRISNHSHNNQALHTFDRYGDQILCEKNYLFHFWGYLNTQNTP